MHGPKTGSPAYGLPIDAYIEEIAALLDQGSLALRAETGAGKTTALQAALARRAPEAGKILVLEPRRLAAIGAALRCAELLGEPVGATAGYRVRGEAKAGPSTSLEFMTVAVFLRIAQDDPFLEGVRLVVFDEFHERSAVGDLCLAFAREAAELRPGLSLLVMSATLEADGVAAYLGCPALSVPGRAFPVELAYRPCAPGQEPAEAAARAAAELHDALDGSILVFLPGQRELGEAQAILRALAPRADTLLLYGALPLERQRAVIAPGEGQAKRIILATSIAETSLTVPGVVAVVDAGLSRFTRYHERSGLNRLVTERVSAAEAEQRRGRAGRLRPGLCLRCWPSDDRLKPLRDPEIRRTELAGLALECALRGDSDRASVRWLEAPPPSAWEAGRELLRELGLLGPDYAISGDGKRAAGLGTEPRSAAALLAAAPRDRQAAALCAALLSEGGGSGPGDEGDLYARFEGAAAGIPSFNAVLREAERLCSKAYGLRFGPAEARAAAGRLGEILAPGFPDRLARRVDDGWEFRSGRRAKHKAGLPERGWIVALECDAGASQIAIYTAVPLGDECARETLRLSARATLSIEWKGLAPRAFERSMAGAFALGERQLKELSAEQASQALAARVEAEGLAWLPWQEESEALLERVRYAARLGRPAGLEPEAWQEPRFAGRLAKALEPYAAVAGPIVSGAGLRSCLEDMARAELGPRALEELEREAPAYVMTPGGRRRRPRYPQQGEAALALRIQEAFGLASSPIVCGRPLVLELLSPADRPLQLTKDIASFWRSAYPSLRPALARRYPKHYWPEDPLNAEPTRGPKPKRL